MLRNLSPSEFTISAVVVGQMLAESLDDETINSIGNWFTLLGQYLETYAAQQNSFNDNNNNYNKKNT